MSALLVYASLPSLNNYPTSGTHVALARSCLVVSCTLICCTRHCGHSLGSSPCPYALVSSLLLCIEDFQTISLTLTFPLSPWPEFSTACWVFHCLCKPHVSDIKQSTRCSRSFLLMITILLAADTHASHVSSTPYLISHSVQLIFSVLIKMTYLFTAKYTLHFPTTNTITYRFTYQKKFPICLLKCSKESQTHL